MRAVRVSASSTIDHQALAVHAHRAADDVVDVEHARRRLRADAPLVQREHRALRDDEQAAQLGQPGDDVVRQRVGRVRRRPPAAASASTNGITAIEARRAGERSAAADVSRIGTAA